MAQEKLAPRRSQAGLTVGDALVLVALIAAAAALIITGHGEWVLILAVVAVFFLPL